MFKKIDSYYLYEQDQIFSNKHMSTYRRSVVKELVLM